MAKEQEAIDWYLGKARTASGYRNIMLHNNPGRNRSGTIMGKMYFFHYDPKTKDRLPIYDRFPLVFPLEPKPNGFLGLNVHYLSQGERQGLLGEMIRFANNEKNDETTRLRITYDMINNTRLLRDLAKPCIKRYLYGHVRSPFVEIYAKEWDNVMSLPLEDFKTKK